MMKIHPILLAAAAVTLSACGGSSDEAGARRTEAVRQTAGADSAGPGFENVSMAAVNSPCGFYGPFDGNGDGAIDQVEYRNFAAVNFDRWDLDDNGAVSRQEYQRCVTDGGYQRLQNAFVVLDRDKNGALASGEFLAPQSYAGMDADGSGVIERQEWA